MIIDLTQSRDEYFVLPDSTEIVRKFITKEDPSSPITIADLKRLALEGRVVVCTREGDLEGLLTHQYTVDDRAMVQRIGARRPDQLIVLPPEYKQGTDQARELIAYDTGNLILLDSMDVRRVLLGDEAPRGRRLSKRAMQQHQWHPEKVLSTKFGIMHQDPDSFLGRPMSCYAWWGTDNHRRVSSVYRDIEGTELRAFQDYVAFKLKIPVMRKEIRERRRAQDGAPLDDVQIERRRQKIRRYESYIRRRNLRPILDRLDCSFKDLIEPERTSFAGRTGRSFDVVSASNPKYPHDVKVTGLAVVEEGNPVAYSQVWEMIAYCDCKDQFYRSSRRRTAFKGQDDFLFCMHPIAAARGLQAIYDDDPDHSLPFLPFVMPKKPMIEFIENLRYNTILLSFRGGANRWRKESQINHTTMEVAAIKKAIIDSYEDCFTTDVGVLQEGRYDPLADLVKFVR